MEKVIRATVNLEDVKAAKDILKTLKAPVTEANILNLKVVIQELGELFEIAYNQMLMNHINKHSVSCTCGKDIELKAKPAPTISLVGKR